MGWMEWIVDGMHGLHEVSPSYMVANGGIEMENEKHRTWASEQVMLFRISVICTIYSIYIHMHYM